MIRKQLSYFLSFVILPLASCLIVQNAFAQSDMSDLVNERKAVLKQVDELSKNEKTFKNKKTIADFQSALKKLVEIDEQIILAANYSINSLTSQRDEALKKKKEVIKTPGTTTVVYAASDSLLNVINNMQQDAGSLNSLLKVKDEALTAIAYRSDSLQTANKRMSAKFDAMAVDIKNTSEKNTILIIFNCLAVLALLICLFFLVRRPAAKKMLLNQPPAKTPVQTEVAPIVQSVPVVAPQPEPEKPKIIPAPPVVKKTEPVIKVSSEGILSSTNDSLDSKLEQLEKLARLREKGFLTDEEFALQKKQILGG